MSRQVVSQVIPEGLNFSRLMRCGNSQKYSFFPLCATTSLPSKPNTFALVIGRFQLLIPDSTGLIASIAVICFKHVSSSAVANTIYFHCYGKRLDCFVYSFTIHYATIIILQPNRLLHFIYFKPTKLCYLSSLLLFLSSFM